MSTQRRLDESTEKYKKVKKLLWSYRLCWIFKNERFDWECPKKCPMRILWKRPKVGVLDKSVRKNKITQSFDKKRKSQFRARRAVNGRWNRIYKKKKSGEFITPAINYAKSAYDEKMPKATICDTCHADRSPRKCGTDRSGSVFLENCYVFIDFGR